MRACWRACWRLCSRRGPLVAPQRPCCCAGSSAFPTPAVIFGAQLLFGVVCSVAPKLKGAGWFVPVSWGARTHLKSWPAGLKRPVDLMSKEENHASPLCCRGRSYRRGESGGFEKTFLEILPELLVWYVVWTGLGANSLPAVDAVAARHATAHLLAV